MDLSKYKKIISFVNQTIIIDNNVQNEKLTRGEKFNVFNVLGLWSEEVQLHSRFLSELLNPKGIHGLKDAFLKVFIKQIGLEKLCIDTLKCEIKIEYNIGSVSEENGGRIDILITDNDKAIIIENKIYAKDQSNQLLRYNNCKCPISIKPL